MTDLAPFFGLLLLALFVALILYSNRVEQHRTESMVKRKIAMHESALRTRYLQLAVPNAYGFIDRSKWDKEVDIFVLSCGLGNDPYVRKIAIRLVNEQIASKVDVHKEADLVGSFNRPVDFEIYCSEVLSKNGWNTRRIGGTGDQGVDIIAEKGPSSVALQCKLYSRPVGNKAVQEVAAGRVHNRTHYAAVVTNSSYTKSALELANSLGVLTLHYSQLGELDYLVRK